MTEEVKFDPNATASGHNVVVVVAELTQRCHKRCAFCYQGQEKEASPHELVHTHYDASVFPRTSELTALLEERFPEAPFQTWVTFLGGEVFMKDGLYKIMYAARQRGFKLALLCNPDAFVIKSWHDKELRKIEKQVPSIRVQNRNLAEVLKQEFGIEFIQFSIHGSTPDVHDTLVQDEGSLRMAYEAIEMIQGAGIVAKTMFVLQPENKHQLLDVIRLAYARNVWVTIDRKTPSKESPEIIPADELRQLYRTAHHLDLQLARENNGRLSLIKRKCHLFDTLTRVEEGDPGFVIDYDRIEKLWSGEDIALVDGCGCGSTVVLDPDGELMPCTKLDAHKVLNVTSLEEGQGKNLMLMLAAYRNPHGFEKCRRCVLSTQCRGCPAIAEAYTSLCGKSQGVGYFAPDPQCWRDPDTPLTDKEAELRERFRDWHEGEGLREMHRAHQMVGFLLQSARFRRGEEDEDLPASDGKGTSGRRLPMAEEDEPFDV